MTSAKLSTAKLSAANLTADSFLNAAPAPEIESRRLAGRRRRALVLTNEAARHPFRASLPMHVTNCDDSGEQEHETAAMSLWRLTRDDVRGFASVYFATFAAVLVFIL